MRKILLCAALSLLLCLTACGAAGGSDSAQAPASTASVSAGEPENVPVKTEYDITAELAVTSDYKQTGEDPLLTETVSIHFTNTSGDVWERVCLRDFAPSNQAVANGYYADPDDSDYPAASSILAVRGGGGQALDFEVQADPSVVFVTLPEPLQPGQRTSVTVDYQAVVPLGGERLSWSQMGGLDDYDQNTICLSQAYPMLAEYLDDGWNTAPYFTDGECFYSKCADYRITLRLPETYTVISSGDEVQNADGTWTLTAENMRDLAVIAGNAYDVLTADAGGVTVRSWFCSARDEDREAGELCLQAAVDAVNAYMEKWGAYPYGTLDVVQAYYNYGGMEYPGMVRISDSYASDLDSEREALKLDVAHEVAHQWFYAVVGNDQYRQAWLDESFAVLGELTYQSYLGASEDELAARVDELAAADVPERYIDLRYDQYVSDQTGGTDYVNAVYRRGPAFLWQLRAAMGADSFDAFLHDWYTGHQFAEVTTADFRAALERAAGENADVTALAAEYLSPPA